MTFREIRLAVLWLAVIVAGFLAFCLALWIAKDMRPNTPIQWFTSVSFIVLGPLAALGMTALYRWSMKQPTVSQCFELSHNGIRITIGLNLEMPWASLEEVSLVSIRLYKALSFGHYQYTFRVKFIDIQGTARVRRINTTVGEKQITELSRALITNIPSEKISVEARTLMESLMDAQEYSNDSDNPDYLVEALRPFETNRINEVLGNLRKLEADNRLDEQTASIYERLSSISDRFA